MLENPPAVALCQAMDVGFCRGEHAVLPRPACSMPVGCQSFRGPELECGF